MNGSTFRKATRIIHLVMAAFLGAFIYSPWSSDPLFAGIVMWVAVPMVTLTGLLMWKQGVVMNWLKSKKKPAMNN